MDLMTLVHPIQNYEIILFFSLSKQLAHVIDEETQNAINLPHPVERRTHTDLEGPPQATNGVSHHNYPPVKVFDIADFYDRVWRQIH